MLNPRESFIRKSLALLLAFVLMTVFLVGCSGEIIPANPSAQKGEPTQLPNTDPANITRTIMIYIVGSDLERENGCATVDIQEMIDAEFDSDKVQVVICAGGSWVWQNEVVSNTETSYYQVTDDTLVKVEQVHQNNMGNDKTLSDFLKWSFSEYPADRYSLILWDHGGGPLYGYGEDEISGDALSMQELREAMADSPFDGDNKMEFLGFDACLMGCVEIAWLFKDYAQYFVASQETEPGTGWNYEFLSNVSSCRDGGEIGRAIIDSYFEFYDEIFELYPWQESELTLSCVDLSKIDTVEKVLDSLFSGVNQSVLSGGFVAASRCRSWTKTFGKSSTSHDFDLVDLTHLASLLSSTYTKASALEQAIDDAVVYSRSNIRNANGLSVYHPYENSIQFIMFYNTYKSMGFANHYSEYIVNFMNCVQKGYANQNSYREFSKTAGTSILNGTQHDLEIQLTEEQIKTFANAKYYVFWEMPSSVTFSKKTEYLQVFSGQDVNVSENGKLTASYHGKAVFGKNNATGEYSDCPLSMDQIYDGSLEEKYRFRCLFWLFDDNLEMDVQTVNWLMKIKNGKPTLLNAYSIEDEEDENNVFPDKQLLNPEDYTIYGFMNNSYFVNKDEMQNTVLEASGSAYGFEYSKEDGLSLELRPIEDKSQYKAVFVVEDIYGNRYLSDFIPLL